MGDSTIVLDTVSSSSLAREAQVNALFDAMSEAALYGRRSSTCAALVFGYYGGRINGTSVANGTVTATASNTNYVVAHRTTYAVSIATTTTNWNDSATYARLYKLTAGGSTITAYEDWRFNTDGTGLILAGSGDMILASVQTVTGAKTFNDGKLKLAGSSSGALILAAPAAAGSGTVTLPASGTLATTADVTSAVNGLSWKQAVRVATTVTGTLASAFENGDTVDGVVLATGDRILLKNQSSAAENGIYVVAASGSPARATDADSGAELVNASVYVSEGTANADSQWTCTTNATITVGSTSLTFAQVAAGVYQPLDSDLTTIAGLTATTDSFLQSKSSAWAARTIAQVRADLIPQVVVAVTYAGTTTVDLSTYASYAIVILDLTLTGNVTFNLTNGTDGQIIRLRVRQDGTPPRVWTSGANLRFNADITAITLSTGASKLDYIAFEWNGTDGKADVLAITKGF